MLTPRMCRSQFVADKACSSEGSYALGDKLVGSLLIPRGPRWSDICDDDMSEDDEQDAVLRQELDSSPKSPSKSARRANRRRRCREAAKAAAAEQAAAELAGEDAFCLGGSACSSTPRGSPKRAMLPARAFVNTGIVGTVPGGNCTPTCMASPLGSSPHSLPAAGFSEVDAACSPSRPRPGSSVSVVSTSPQAKGIVGDASTRTPTAGTCASPYMCGASAGSDASARTPGARLLLAPAAGSWSVIGSPTTRASLSTGPSIVSTSPMAAAVTRVPPVPAACGPAGSAAADALRSLLGPGGMAAGNDLAARLRAAAPEIYED